MPQPMVCRGGGGTEKNEGSVRICVDLKALNESVLRQVHPLPKVDETLGDNCQVPRSSAKLM